MTGLKRALRQSLGDRRRRRVSEQQDEPFATIRRVGLTYQGMVWTMSGQAHAFYGMKKRDGQPPTWQELKRWFGNALVGNQRGYRPGEPTIKAGRPLGV